jgi:uncharacterized repeat protein (TIGR01451 family)
VNAVLTIAMLGWLGQGQLPPLPLVPAPGAAQPAPPAPAPGQALMPAPRPTIPDVRAPAPQQDSRPPALTPVNPDAAVSVQAGPEGYKPPAFRLVDTPPPVEVPKSNKPGPTPTPDPLPPGTVATPCLVLQRSQPLAAKTGQPFTYEISVKNVGASAAGQAQLLDCLPLGTRYLGGEPIATILGDGEKLQWTLENLAPGAERRVRVEVEPTREGEWKAQATVTVALTSSVQVQVAAGPVPPLSVLGPPHVTAGHLVPVTIRVTNSTAGTWSNAVVRVQMSSGLQHLQGNVIEGAIGDVVPGKTRELPLSMVAQQAGPATIEVTVLQGKTSVANARANLTVTEPGTLVLKQAGPATVRAGVEQEFKLEVANRGTLEIRDVVVTDTLPENLELVSAEGASFDRGTRKLQWNLPPLASGHSHSLVFRAVVRGQEPMTNRATARAAGMPEAQLHAIVRPAPLH